jgi:hypothetical protein
MEEPTTEVAADLETEQPNPQEEVEQVDPGQLEGLPKKHEPPEGSKRWNDIYRENKEKGRVIEAKDETIAAITAEKERLLKELETAKTAPTMPQHEKVQPEASQEPLGPSELDVELQTLQSEMGQAMRDLDGDKQAELYGKIEAVKDKISKERYTFNPNDITKIVQQQQRETAEQEFHRKNDWFLECVNGQKNPNFDPYKSGAATVLARTLGETWTGTTRELLEEVSRQVTEKFTSPAKPKISAVAGVGAAKQVATNNVVELNETQRRVAMAAFGNEPDPIQAYKNELLKGAN